MRILVTGSAGLIGSHLCERLLQEGHYVIALDNFMTGRPENMADFINHPNFEFHEFDVVQPFEPENGPVGAIFHLACPASPRVWRTPYRNASGELSRYSQFAQVSS